MIKRLPPETLKYLLDMYNKIWEEREIPNTWKHATITPLLKERKNPKYIRSYKIDALTNTLQNIGKDDKKKDWSGIRKRRRK